MHGSFLLARKEAWVERPNLVKSGKEKDSITPILIRNALSCGMKSLRISGHFMLQLTKKAIIILLLLISSSLDNSKNS